MLSWLPGKSQTIKAPESPSNGDVIEIYDKAQGYFEKYAIYDSFTVKGFAGILIDIEEQRETIDSLMSLTTIQNQIIESKDARIDNLKIESAIKDRMTESKDLYIEQQALTIKEYKDDSKKKAKSNTMKDIALSLVIVGLSISTIVLGAK